MQSPQRWRLDAEDKIGRVVESVTVSVAQNVTQHLSSTMYHVLGLEEPHGHLIRDRELAEELIAERRARCADRHDEVWEDVYVVSPLADFEHQFIVGRLQTILDTVIGLPGLGVVVPGVNVSDRQRGWKKNYRCPDVAVRLEGGRAEIRATYWVGGPDFLVEVVSPDDQTYEKLPFYESIGTREVLVIDRKPWSLVLYQQVDGKLLEAKRGTVDNGQVLVSPVVPLAFRLLASQNRPQVEVTHTASGQRWVIWI